MTAPARRAGTSSRTWPTATYATLICPRLTEEETRSRVFRWQGHAWRQIPNPKDTLLREFYASNDGRVLTAEDHDQEPEGDWALLRLMPGSHGREPVLPGTRKFLAVVASPAGTLFVALYAEGVSDMGYAVARFGPDGDPPIAVGAAVSLGGGIYPYAGARRGVRGRTRRLRRQRSVIGRRPRVRRP